MNLQSMAPEQIKDEKYKPDMKSDIWGVGSTILQFLLDHPTWDLRTLSKQFAITDQKAALKEVRIDPPGHNPFHYYHG